MGRKGRPPLRRQVEESPHSTILVFVGSWSETQLKRTKEIKDFIKKFHELPNPGQKRLSGNEEKTLGEESRHVKFRPTDAHRVYNL